MKNVYNTAGRPWWPPSVSHPEQDFQATTTEQPHVRCVWGLSRLTWGRGRAARQRCPPSLLPPPSPRPTLRAAKPVRHICVLTLSCTCLSTGTWFGGLRCTGSLGTSLIACSLHFSVFHCFNKTREQQRKLREQLANTDLLTAGWVFLCGLWDPQSSVLLPQLRAEAEPGSCKTEEDTALQGRWGGPGTRGSQ